MSWKIFISYKKKCKKHKQIQIINKVIIYSYFSLINRGQHVFEYLNEHIERLAGKQNNHAVYLTKNFHVWPDFHGNRAPVADPNLKGMVSYD